jgi:protein TonB
MNAALNRPTLNTTILVSVAFHLAVLYYLASSWQIIPPLTPAVVEPPSVPIMRPEPPPPVVPDQPEPPKVRPHRVPRVNPTSPVEPLPIPAQPPSNAPGGPLVMNSTVPDQPTSFVKPVYPQIALNGEKEGHVRLSITILPDGSVTDVQVVSASPPGYFERSAIDAVKRWRYPATGTTRTNVYVDIDYQLTG